MYQLLIEHNYNGAQSISRQALVIPGIYILLNEAFFSGYNFQYKAYYKFLRPY